MTKIVKHQMTQVFVEETLLKDKVILKLNNLRTVVDSLLSDIASSKSEDVLKFVYERLETFSKTAKLKKAANFASYFNNIDKFLTVILELNKSVIDEYLANLNIQTPSAEFSIRLLKGIASSSPDLSNNKEELQVNLKYIDSIKNLIMESINIDELLEDLSLINSESNKKHLLEILKLATICHEEDFLTNRLANQFAEMKLNLNFKTNLVPSNILILSTIIDYFHAYAFFAYAASYELTLELFFNIIVILTGPFESIMINQTMEEFES